LGCVSVFWQVVAPLRKGKFCAPQKFHKLHQCSRHRPQPPPRPATARALQPPRPASDTFGVPYSRRYATPLGFASGIAERREYTPTDPTEPSPLGAARACAYC
jgi:hypothetical protein